MASDENYNAFSYNYGYSFQNMQPTSIFQVEVRGLTHSGKVFYPRGTWETKES